MVYYCSYMVSHSGFWGLEYFFQWFSSFWNVGICCIIWNVTDRFDYHNFGICAKKWSVCDRYDDEKNGCGN